ncbi:17-beta-hydroxysteroid dehydrogenase type 6-like isoform X1 [Varroa jacobsoni]|uniref:Uncharacterized protein n=1 Tax=Varroa destructor TaxID=109461 RepID=A0A7M7IZY1_VARDE|nr:17-beta-hydroxysteroid dehydrogenase type 6-like isoform X2 [Varroa destructor]XP_022708506.1 17-beta-hydroxysteroid dehydrogenase type 6-like isoform X1 [Varroa jacobsoni]
MSSVLRPGGTTDTDNKSAVDADQQQRTAQQHDDTVIQITYVETLECVKSSIIEQIAQQQVSSSENTDKLNIGICDGDNLQKNTKLVKPTKHSKGKMLKKLRNTAKANMYRQVIVYLCMAPALCSLLMVPVVQYVLLYTSAITGLCVLWLSIGWFIAYYRMPSVKLSSKGKAVLITGCDSGFGYKLALKLDCEGYQVFAGCLFPDGEGARQLRNSASNRLHIIGLDVTKDEDFTSARSFVQQHLNGNVLWAVVANAGIFEFKEFEWFTSDEISRTLDVNVLGVCRTALTFLPLLRDARGRLVIVSSYAGRLTPSWHSVYSMSKHALIALADGLRKELYKFDVGVVTIEPFYFRTAILPLSDVICERFQRQQGSEMKALYSDEYVRTEAYSQIAFMDLRARDNAYEVVDTMATAISVQYPQSNYRVDGFCNWALCQLFLHVPPILVDWADYLAHARWSRGINDKLIRRQSAYERLFGRFPIPDDSTLEKNTH